MAVTVSDRLRVEPGEVVDLSRVATGTPEWAPGDKEANAGAAAALADDLADLQERLWAEKARSLLVVLQAIDAGGKDGAIRKVFTGMNPMGVKVTSFGVPTEEERAHDFLWRVHEATPAKGEIGIFNRSHYEDVLVVRVHDLVPEEVWRPRYELINDFERNLAMAGTRIVKLFLHISKEEQAERFRSRLEQPDKRWKFRKGDLDDRARWDDFQAAFAEAISRTSTDVAPWYVVPADSKRFRDWAVSEILVDTLRAMDPQFPEPEEGLDGIVVV